MSDHRGESRAAFFGSFPTRGVWTVLGLTRVQFFAILTIAVISFLFLDGPLWQNLTTNHFRRIVVSYTAIPAMIFICQFSRGGVDWPRMFGGSVVIGVIKLLITALIVLFMTL